MIVWVDGALVDQSAVRFGPLDRGLTLGDGLFETMLWADGRIVRVERHWARFAAGCAYFGFSVEFSQADLGKAAENLVAASALSDGEAILRLTLTRGEGPRGLGVPLSSTPRLVLVCQPRVAAPPPALLATVSIERNPSSPSARFKTLSYIDAIAALAEASSRGGNEAMMLGTSGKVACASASNIFIWCNGGWITPPVSDGAMPGTVRAALLGADAREASFSLKDVQTCEAAALTNAVIGIRPVASVEGSALALDHPALDDLRAMLRDSPSR